VARDIFGSLSAVGILPGDPQHAASSALLDEIMSYRWQLDPSVMTIGFAYDARRRARADLIFSDPDRLTQIAQQIRSYGGKAHPHDGGGRIHSGISARERFGVW
jgi:hypothetical protein